MLCLNTNSLTILGNYSRIAGTFKGNASSDITINGTGTLDDFIFSTPQELDEILMNRATTNAVLATNLTVHTDMNIAAVEDEVWGKLGYKNGARFRVEDQGQLPVMIQQMQQQIQQLQQQLNDKAADRDLKLVQQSMKEENLNLRTAAELENDQVLKGLDIHNNNLDRLERTEQQPIGQPGPTQPNTLR